MASGDVRLRARRELEQLGLSVESASFIVDDRPPGGWGSLVTHNHLRAALAELKGDLRSEMSDLRVEMANLASELRKEMRDQTRWLTGVLLVAMTLVAGIARFA
jgi:hypothetical protein